MLIPKRIKHPCSFIFKRAIALDPNLNIQFCSGEEVSLNEPFNSQYFIKKEDFVLPKECKLCNILPLCLGGCPIRKKNIGLACIPEKFIIKDILESVI
ncbi:SPASM domain-containing protein [Fusobacteria bacterium ZRK30]|nr:SPASM domain-containing protein [Fusobacteria bacterium ZRK30]